MKENTTRLNKFIAQSGLCSRRKADEFIEQGKVKVNGKTVSELGFSVSEKDKVTVNDEKIKPSELKYIKFYKPAGYITSLDDEKNRKTIYNLLPVHFKYLKPIGRLDKDSTGLLILTNDGELINLMTHPSVKVPKVYRVLAKGKLKIKDLEPFAVGIELEKGKLAFADVQIIDYEENNTVLEIVLYQGMNRQIRRMLEFIGSSAITLKRISHANIDLSGLKRTQYKYLKPKQVKDLWNFVSKAHKASG